MTDHIADDHRKTRKVRILRGALIALSLLNTILIPCSVSSLNYGLIPTEISLAVNGLILFCPQTLGQPVFMLFSDTIFTLGFFIWFIFANIIMSAYGFASPSSIVTGTWSSVITLVMLVISAILVTKTGTQLGKENARAQVKPQQCPHCCASGLSVTPSDGMLTPSSPHIAGSTVSGLRQMMAGYVPVARADQLPPYCDEEGQQSGKIAPRDEAVTTQAWEQGF